MRKLFVSVLCVISMLLLCVGCTYGSGTIKSTTKSVFNTKEMTMEYEGFNGFKQKKIKLKKGSSITYDITSTEGSINILIQDLSTNDYLVNERTTNFLSGEVEIENTAEYFIKVKAENHSGSFSIIIY